APTRQGTAEQHDGNREPKERQGVPLHVHEGLLDRDEREPPDEDEEEHGAVDGPARAEPVRQRHAAGTWAGDKKVRAAIAGAHRKSTAGCDLSIQRTRRYRRKTAVKSGDSTVKRLGTASGP